jgi:3-phenylpropionate/trans-cinnamate dioxygenase ferredoxin reductase subunit
MGAVESMRSEGYVGPITVIDASPVLPHDRPPLTKQVLAGEWELERAKLPVADRLEELDLEVLLGVGAVTLDVSDRRVTLQDGTSIEASAIAIATGSVPRDLGSPRPPGAHVLRTGDEALTLRAALDTRPDRVLVVGAGFIGAEVAATCRGRGLDVTMIEAGPVPLERVLPGGVGGFVAELHRAHGVDVRLSTPLERIVLDADGHAAGVEVSGGELIESQVVVMGIGAAPVVGWLEDSGLDLVRPDRGGGVLCDPTLLAAPGVVAAGDVAAWPNSRYGAELMRVEHWENAIDQGVHAGRRLLAEVDVDRWGPPGEFSSVPWFWSDQYGSKIQMVGRAGAQDEAIVVEGALDEERFLALFRRGDRCTAVLGMNRPRHVMQARMAMADSLDWNGVAGLF